MFVLMDNSEINDGVNFVDKRVPPNLLKAFGWICKDFKTYDGLAPVKADFYPKGWVLALSKRAIIICDGETLIRYKGEEYYSFDELKQRWGNEAYLTFPDWEIIEEKEWVIKKNGEWLYSFSDFSELPFRSEMKRLTGVIC